MEVFSTDVRVLHVFAIWFMERTRENLQLKHCWREVIAKLSKCWYTQACLACNATVYVQWCTDAPPPQIDRQTDGQIDRRPYRSAGHAYSAAGVRVKTLPQATLPRKYCFYFTRRSLFSKTHRKRHPKWFEKAWRKRALRRVYLLSAEIPSPMIHGSGATWLRSNIVFYGKSSIAKK